MQQALLDGNTDARLRVYAVWFNIFPGDARDGWRADLLTDARVIHYWDDTRAVGDLYYQRLPHIWPARAVDTLPPVDTTLWDAYLLYAPGARWDEQPPDLVSWGSTILLTRDTLSHNLEEVLKR